MHTKFELNWMKGVAREIHKVSPRILKQETNLNSGTYKPNLGNVNFPNPPRWGKMDVEFFVCNFKKNPNFEFISKSYGRFTKPPLS
jgi:hypothetical protein